MLAHEIRAAYRNHFEQNGHLVMPSASLVPGSLDPSVLLTTAGMQPFKPFFLGLDTPPATRLTSVQKCFRTTDIDEVGKTARHLTFFEMMGNFSFGDYFKAGAIEFAWTLVGGPWQMDLDKVWITVFAGDDRVPGDDEARDLWLAQGVPAERIVGLGRKDNFWQAGPTGPCGPCSELYYDRGPEHGCGRATGPDGCQPGCDCDRFLEFWNLVFMQYDQAEDGSLSPLPKTGVDTGAGVERVAALQQGVHSVYETDGFKAIIAAIEDWTGTSYESGGIHTKALRVLADHGRAMTFLAADGVLPANESRGYILRRVIRRAVSHGHRLGIEGMFLERLSDLVIAQLGDVYPELVQNRAEVIRILTGEEERFLRTLDTGTNLLEECMARVRAEGGTAIPAAEAFQLHDTFGFPFELTQELAAEEDLFVDEAGFAELMEAQRQRARSAAGKGGGVDMDKVATFAREAGFATEFVGYGELDIRTRIGALTDLGEGRLAVKLRESPFYPEGGGQVSDAGHIESDTGRGAIIEAIRFDKDQTLIVVMEHGELMDNQEVRAIVDPTRRRPTQANHTGTHVLHRALQEVLGDHVRQKGSSVRPDKLRFDFSHETPMTPEELARVEDIVNRVVIEGHRVFTFETSQDEARALGAMMLFGEKYGDVVRVVEIEGFSRELCGGTHVATTAEIGPIRITSESSVGQGVRRIEAVTSGVAIDLLRQRERAAEEAAKVLKVGTDRLPEAVRDLQAKVRELEKQLKAGGASAGGAAVDDLAAMAELRGGVKLVAAGVGEIAPEALLELADHLRGSLGPSVVLLIGESAGKVALICAATPEAVAAGADAGAVLKAAAPLVGGGGGGKPNLARAGGKDAAGIPAALEAGRAVLVEQLPV
jgi:alanyl-tRNA synthetase